MPLGEFAPGEGRFGSDPVAPTGPPRSLEPPEALLFDGRTRTFPYDDDGKLKTIHPVDQAVALSVLVEMKKINSNQGLGSTLRKAPAVGGPRLQADVERRVRAAVKARIDAEDIEILEILGVSVVRGRTSVRLRYINRRLPNSKPKTITV